MTIISLLLVRPLLAILAASFANIALDLLFVMGFGWGIFGASFATVLAQLIAFLLCLRSLRRLPFVQLAKADWKTDPAILLHLCRLGIPTGLQMSIDHTGRHGAAVRIERLRRGVRSGLYGGK